MIDKILFVFIGAKILKSATFNPGGQLTASIALQDYASHAGYDMEVIDTTQMSFPVPPFFTRLRKGVSRVLHLIRLLHTKKVDGLIIFSANGYSFYERIMMAGIARIYGVKSLFFMRSGLFKKEMHNAVKRIIVKLLLKMPHTIAIQGESWRDFFLHLGVNQERIALIRNWLPSHVECAKQPKKLNVGERMRFCFAGWLVEEKGVNELFEAIRTLSKQYDFEFFFVGGGVLQEELSHKIAQSGLSDRITLTGWVDTNAVINYLQTSHVFVLPSKAEGFPNALLEAFACGLPAICTNVGAIADSLYNEKNGYLLQRCDPKLIAQAMQSYLVHSEKVFLHSIEALKVIQLQHDRDINCKLVFDQFLSC